MSEQRLIDFPQGEGGGHSGKEMLRQAGFFQKKTADDPQAKMTQMLYAIADMGGEATVEMVEAAGYHWTTIAMALEKPSDDGRKKAPLADHSVGDLMVVALTSQGWQRVGKTGMRERKPNVETITHRLLPGKIAAHLDATIGRSERWQNICRVTPRVSHEKILDWQTQCTALAWADLRTRSDAGGEVGVMTSQQGTPRPDLIIHEEWHQLLEDRLRPWNEPGDKLWKTPAGGNEILLPRTFTILVEVETSHKSSDNLEAKVKRLNAAMRIRAADAVVWVTDDESIASRVAQFVAVEGGNNDGSHAFASVAEMTGEVEGGMPTLMPDRCRPYWVPSAVRRVVQSRA